MLPVLQEKRMTFGEHLEELRARIIKTLYFVAAAFAVALLFQSTLMRIVVRPHQRAFEQLAIRWGFDAFGDSHEVLRQTYGQLEARPSTDAQWWAILGPQVRLRRTADRFGRVWSPLAETIEIRAKNPEVSPDERTFLLGMARELKGAGTALGIELTRAFEGSVGALDELRLEARLGDTAADVHGIVADLEKDKALRASQKDLAATLEEDLRRLSGLFGRRTDELPAEARDMAIAPEVREELDALDQALARIRAASDKLREADKITLTTLTYMEGFMSYLKVALIFALIASVPVALYQMWLFIGAGLYANEQKYVRIFLPFSLILFAVGMSFGYGVMIPFGLQYLGGYGSREIIQTSVKLSEYITLLLTLTLVLGIVFELPLVMVFLSKIGVPPEFFRKYRRHSIILAFIVGAILTPPDPISQLLMAGPLVVLYEVGVIAAKIAGRRKAPPPGRPAEA
ncbi:MAG: twin-arginine translocase subunit TatC [Planctomycetes bacterium]|nr:twin-arginine translocase subunit TatC [Planctomycetota bacterium]